MKLQTASKASADYILRCDDIRQRIAILVLSFKQTSFFERRAGKMLKLFAIPAPGLALAFQQRLHIAQAGIGDATSLQVIPHFHQSGKFVQQHHIAFRVKTETAGGGFQKEVRKAGGDDLNFIAFASGRPRTRANCHCVERNTGQNSVCR